jgi:hypothetical protein
MANECLGWLPSQFINIVGKDDFIQQFFSLAGLIWEVACGVPAARFGVVIHCPCPTHSSLLSSSEKKPQTDKVTRGRPDLYSALSFTGEFTSAQERCMS